jgi:competence protein ComEC
MMEFLRKVSRKLMAAAPLSPVAIGIISGIVIDRRLGPDPWIFGSLLAGATIAALFGWIRELIAPLIVAMAALAAGGLLHWSAAWVIPASSVERVADREGRIARIRGVVASEPRLLQTNDGPFLRWQYRSDETAFLLDVEKIEGKDGWFSATGLIRVTMREAVFDLREGESVEVFGRIVALAPPMNPGAFDWRDFYRLQGVVARMYCDQRENVARLDKGAPAAAGWVGWMRAEARGLLTNDIATGAPEEASLLEAMVLGHRSRFDRRLNEVFTRAGCIHFIAVSGTNIVVLMGAVWFAGRLVGLNRRRCAWAMAATVVLYTVLAEPRPPVLRACVMGLLFCAALLLRRTGAHFNWICTAAVLLCLFEPNTVFDVGFQLSFAAVLGVAYLSPALYGAMGRFYWWARRVILRDRFAESDAHLQAVATVNAPVDWRRRTRRMGMTCVRILGVTLVVSLAAWACGLPITAVYFQQIQLWGAPNSLLVYPLMSVVMILGLMKVVAAALSPALAALLSSVLARVDELLIRLVERLAGLPGASVFVSSPPWWLTASFYLFLLAFAVHFKRRVRPTVTDGEDADEATSGGASLSGWACVGTLSVLTVCAIAWCRPVTRVDRMVIDVLSVGAGSATVIELPSGETILYDAGSLSRMDVGESVVVPFLRDRGIRRLEEIYLSHPNLDHFSGVPAIVGAVPCGPVIVNRCFSVGAGSRSPSRHLLQLLSLRGHAVEVLDPAKRAWERGGVRFEVLWPGDAAYGDLKPNDASTVLRLSYAGHSVLFTGDIEEAAERALIERGGLGADVLMLPHHGSVRPTTRAFLAAVGATVCVRSSGHRTEHTDNGLAELVGEMRVFNTADVGAVRIEIDAEGVRMEPYRELTAP